VNISSGIVHGAQCIEIHLCYKFPGLVKLSHGSVSLNFGVEVEEPACCGVRVVLQPLFRL
jgi:hypothetical protein